MTTKKQLVHYLKQLPSLKAAEQLLDTLAYLLEQLSLSESDPALTCSVDAKAHHLALRLYGLPVLEQHLGPDGPRLYLLLRQQDVPTGTQPFLQTIEVKDQTLVQIALDSQDSEHFANTWRPLLLPAAMLALQALFQNSEVQRLHNPWLYQAAMDTFVRQQILKAVSQQDHYHGIVQKAVNELLSNAELWAIKEAEEFWLEKGQVALAAFEESHLPNPAAYDAFLEAYRHHQGRYDDFVDHLTDRPNWHRFALRLGQLVAYCHARAANKQAWNDYPDKRTVDDTGVLQSLWVPQLVAYRRAGNDLQAINTIVARHALRYLQQPARYLPLLSRKWRHQIAEHLLDRPYDNDTFDTDLLHYFGRYEALQTRHPDNRPWLIRALLHWKGVRELWKYTDEDIYQAERLELTADEPNVAYWSLAHSPLPLNQILYGPPGCGKTYSSIRRALALVKNLPLVSIEELDEHSFGHQLKHYQSEGQLTFITFHQAMSYEDFIEGIKPVVNGQHVQYEVQDGLLKQLASRALAQPYQSFVLIIDELNRGNVVQIFGELLTLLEADKRLGQPNALTVQLPYSKEAFALPPNLYLIGTMNSTDHSTEQLDLALRRRFSFIHLPPQPEKLAKDVEGIDLQLLLQSINERITLLLDERYTIGHAYLMNVHTFKELETVFSTQIIPLLVAYFHGDLGKIGLVLGKDFLTKQAFHSDRFANFDYEGISQFYDKPNYQLTTSNLEKSSYIRIYS